MSSQLTPPWAAYSDNAMFAADIEKPYVIEMARTFCESSPRIHNLHRMLSSIAPSSRVTKIFAAEIRRRKSQAQADATP